MSKFTIVLIFVCVTTCCQCSDKGGPSKDQVLGLTDMNGYETFLEMEGLKLIFYFRQPESTPTPKGNANYLLESFQKEYEKSAKVLAYYRIPLAKLLCTDTTIQVSYCQDGVNKKVFAFRNRNEIIGLNLDNMFDVDSIVSNVLQLALLEQVPILQKDEDLTSLIEQGQQAGKHLIVSHQKAIGTPDHRVFVEVAYVFQGRYKFALSTDPRVFQTLISNDQLSRDSASWFINSTTGTYTRYLGTVTLQTLAKFIANVELQPQWEADSFSFDPYKSHDMPTLYYLYDETTEEQMRFKTEELIKRYRGLIGIVMINTDKVDAQLYGFKDITYLPAVAIRMSRQEEKNLMPPNYELMSFVYYQLIRDLAVFTPDIGKLSKSPMSTEEGAHGHRSDVSLEGQETEDDPVAIAAQELKMSSPSYEDITELTDKTFNSTVSQAQFTTVLFHVTFDAPSVVFLPSYNKASAELQREGLPPLTVVDCFDWTDVCKQEGVLTYPTVRHYKDGTYRQYKGMLSTSAVIAAGYLISINQPIHLTSLEEIEEFIDLSYLKNCEGKTRVAILGLLRNTQDLQIFEEVTHILKDKYIFGYALDTLARQWSTNGMQLPGLQVHRKYDSLEKVSVYEDEWTLTDILHFLKRKTLATIEQLTVESFPQLSAQNKPLVILFTDNANTASYSALVENYQNAPLHDFQYTWIKNSDPVAQHLRQAYALAEGDAVAVVNRSEGVVYTIKDFVDSPEDVMNALQKIKDRQATPTAYMKNHKWLPRYPAYDFLRMIEEQDEVQFVDHEDDETGRTSRLMNDEQARAALFSIHQTKPQTQEDYPHVEL